MKTLTKIMLLALVLLCSVACQRQTTTITIQPVPFPVEVINQPDTIRTR